MSFDVVVTRFTGARGESPADLLERLLGLEPARARELTRTLPSVVVARTTREHASLLADQLRSEGADVQVVQTSRRAEPAARQGAQSEPRRAAIREEVRARNDGRSDDAGAFVARREPRRSPAREVLAVAVEEREPSPRVLAVAVEERKPSPRVLATAAEERETSPRVLGQEGKVVEQAVAHAAEELARRARESAALVALVEKDLGTIDFARFSEPANETAFRNEGAGSEQVEGVGLAADFGKDPLFSAQEPARPTPGSALIDEFDDVVNRPLAFAGALAKPAPVRHDSEIEDLFSGAPLRGNPVPARKAEPRGKTSPGAARNRASPVPPAPVEVTPLDIKPRRGALVAKLGALLVLLLVLGVLGLALSDGDTAGHAVHTGADAKLESGDATLDDMHVLVRMMPRGMDRSMGVVLRQLVSGTHNVQVDVEGLPSDTQCLLIKADDGKATLRLRKLLRTGARVPLSDELNAALDEHEQSLRLAMGAERMKFKRVCLSVDLYKESLKSGAPE